MDQSELSKIFKDLYFGAERAGWAYDELARVQVLICGRDVWARQVGAANETGAWTLLPAPDPH